MNNDNSQPYYGCNAITKQALTFNGTMPAGKYVGLCCEGLGGDILPPYISLGKNGQETIENFLLMRDKVIEESGLSAGDRVHSNGCLTCAHYRLQEWPENHQIKYINLSQYPSPCQCMCVYCSLREEGLFDVTPESERINEIILEALDYAFEKDLIHPEATWQVSCGEITIHPFRQRIYDLLSDKQVCFYTNAMLFDEHIARNLSANPRSSINLSIDSGTASTWHKVKGIDNFGKVVSNLERYAKHSSRDGQITLKYILLPEVNANLEDYDGLIGIMKSIRTSHLVLSRDALKGQKYKDDAQILTMAASLVARLKRNDFTCDMHWGFNPREEKKIRLLAEKLLEENQ